MPPRTTAPRGTLKSATLPPRAREARVARKVAKEAASAKETQPKVPKVQST